MRAALGDSAVVEDDDLIGVDDRRKAVGDHHRGAAPGDSVERFLDGLLGAAVERRGGFVEDQDRGVLEQGAGDGDALLLAADSLSPRSPTIDS